MNKIKVIAVSVLAGLVLLISILPAAANDSPEYSANAGSIVRQSAVECEYPGIVAPAGEALVFNLAASDPDSDALSFTASNLPPGAAFDTRTGTFSWTPGFDQAGIYSNIRFQVSDGQLIDYEDITITVINYNRVPVLASIGSKTTAVNQALVFTATATDPDNDALILSATGLPSGAVFNPQTGAFSWTPSSAQAGIYSKVHFQVSDGQLTDAEDITITVTSDGASATGIDIPIFSVSALTINPAKVNPDKKVTIRVVAANSGTAAGTYEVVLKINGLTEEARYVKIAAGSSVTVSFTTVKSLAGDYTVDVNGLTGMFTVASASRTPKK